MINSPSSVSVPLSQAQLSVTKSNNYSFEISFLGRTSPMQERQIEKQILETKRFDNEMYLWFGCWLWFNNTVFNLFIWFSLLLWEHEENQQITINKKMKTFNKIIDFFDIFGVVLPLLSSLLGSLIF